MVRIGMSQRLVFLILPVSFVAPCTLAQQLDASDPLQSKDPLQAADRSVRDVTHDVLDFTLEERTRWEEKDGVNFGKSVNQQDMLSRLRIGARLRPLSWLTVSAMGQDARVPFYGVPAPNTIRDTMDLQEAYLELFGQNQTGFGGLFGRQMTDFGESRLIGSPQWSNVSKTYDSGRLYYRTKKARFEVLMVSPVKVLPDSFNTPDLGERIWGTYDIFSDVGKGVSIDAYALRHSQNLIGGWIGLGTLGTDSFGGRLYGALPAKLHYSLEGIGQTGHAGLLEQRAFAWFAGASRQFDLRSRQLNLSGEYKGASGTNSGSTNSGTFDQLSPANHDKFGHMDLFGWRNLKTLRSLETLNLTKRFAWNVMYSDERLYSASDGLYNSQGSVISVSKRGTAGTHVGQELDTFLTYKRGAHTFGAGFGHFFKGQFIEETTRDVNPRYFYVFQQYSIR
jgi:Alginate export